MTTYHTLTAADVTYAGNALHGGLLRGRRGVPMSHILVQDYGVIAAALAEGFIKDATSTELPNAETVTYTADTDGTGPSDATTRPAVVSKNIGGVATNVWDLATARNIVAVATHATSVVAMTILASGYDEYMEPMSELLTITATGTSKTATGKKAFRYLRSLALVAAGNAEANTLDVGTGVVIGLPVKIATKNGVLNVRMDGADDATATIVAGVATSPATTTTGDVRGTISFASAPDGTRDYLVVLFVKDRSSKLAAFGVTQA